jgi:hypothetical protein
VKSPCLVAKVVCDPAGDGGNKQNPLSVACSTSNGHCDHEGHKGNDRCYTLQNCSFFLFPPSLCSAQPDFSHG